MWILYLLLYLIGVYVTIFLLSFCDPDFNNVSVGMALLWPVTIALFIPTALGVLAYDIGQWYKYEKSTTSLIKYIKTKGTFSK